MVPDFQIDVSERGEITVSFPGNIPALAIEESFEQAVRRMKDRAVARKDKDSRFIMARYGDAVISSTYCSSAVTPFTR